MSPYSERSQGGRFAPADGPTAKRVEVWLDPPTLAIVDAHAKAIGQGRGKAIADLLKPTASGGTPESSQPPDIAGLEVLFSPNRKPMFVGKPKEWWYKYGHLLAERSAFVADSDCRGLVGTVLELQRDDYWRQFSSDWGEFCLATFGRPAAWIEQVIESVRVLHCSPGLEELTASGAAAPAVEPTASDASPEPTTAVEAPPKAVREWIAMVATTTAQNRRGHSRRVTPDEARALGDDVATAMELFAQKLKNPRKRWKLQGPERGWLEDRLMQEVNAAHQWDHIEEEHHSHLEAAQAYRAVAEWLGIELQNPCPSQTGGSD